MPTTTERGYGAAHQRARKRALAALVDGDACGLCGRPMFREQRLHYDHTTPLALGGDGSDGRLVHGTCNESAGTRVREYLRGGGERVATRRRRAGWYTPGGLRVSCQWAADVAWSGPGRPPAGTALPIEDLDSPALTP